MKTVLVVTNRKQAEAAAGVLHMLPQEMKSSTQVWNLMPEKEQLRVGSVDEIQVCHLEAYHPHMYLEYLEVLYVMRKPEVILFLNQISGNELGGRLAVRIGGNSLLDVVSIQYGKESLILEKMIYASYVTAEYQIDRFPVVVSLDYSRIPKRPLEAKTKGDCEVISVNSKRPEWLISVDREAQTGIIDLSRAEFICVAGKGVGDRENYQKLRQVAAYMKGETGVSRAAALSGWASMENMIGQSGLTVAPDVGLLVGVSGAAPFLSGIENGRFLIAVNNDPDAPVFRCVDIGVMDEASEFIENLRLICTL